MVSIYSLRPVYTFIYTLKNRNVIDSFVQKKNSFEILWSKKNFFVYVRNLENPPSPLYEIVHIWLDPSPPPLWISTTWMTALQNEVTSENCKKEYLLNILHNNITYLWKKPGF